MKTIAQRMKEKGFSSSDIGYCSIAENYLCELLYSEFFNQVISEMETLESEELEENRGKPKTKAEYLELIGDD